MSILYSPIFLVVILAFDMAVFYVKKWLCSFFLKKASLSENKYLNRLIFSAIFTLKQADLLNRGLF